MEMTMAMFKDTPLRCIIGYEPSPLISRAKFMEMIETVNEMLRG